MARKKIRTEEDLKNFMTCCPELFQDNEIIIFQKFMCPISIVEADVKEYVTEEYESVELLVLRLYEAGITTPELISEITGIDKSMISKLIFSEIYTYGHINSETGEITDAGRDTLTQNENDNNEKLWQHALYNAKRELQVDAMTGTIIRAEMEMMKDKMISFNDSIQPNLLPLESVVIDKELEQEITDRLGYYIERGYMKDGNSISDVERLYTKEIKYRMAYYVVMKEFCYPFITIPYFKIEENESKRYVIPVAISISDMERCDYENRKHEYLVKRDECFEYLTSYKKCFESCPELDDDTIHAIWLMENEENITEEMVADVMEYDASEDNIV